MGQARTYLDNAATSWPKPEEVYTAVEAYQRHCGAAVGRGVYREAIEASKAVERARGGIAQLIGAEDPRQIVFTANGTDALNLAIHSALSPGDHVVTTVVEHNSVLRPLRWLEDRGVIRVTRVACDAEGIVPPAAIARALCDETKLVAVLHASNVTGALQKVAEIGRIVAPHDALFLVDAAQTLGHVSIDVRELQADLLAAPGHKGLLGPLGTGLLYLREGVETRLESVRQGGTGSLSEQDRQPASLPDKYESGNHNAPGLCGLAAAVDYVLQRGVDDLCRHASQLSERLRQGLAGIEGVSLYGPANIDDRVGVVSMNLKGYDSRELAALLESAFRVQVRAGIHCAPRMHESLGTLSTGGTVRFSFGAMNTPRDADAAVSAIKEIAAAGSPN